MSSFIVEDRTINRVVSYLGRYQYCGDLKYGHIPTTIRSLSKIEITLETLGEEMFKINLKATGQRYNGRIEDFRALTYKPRTSKTNIFQVLKSLRCFLYQCSEGSVPSTELYKILDGLSNAIARSIVEEMLEYEKAKWE